MINKTKLNPRKAWEIEYLPMHDDAVVPKRADQSSIGYDLVVPEDIHVPAHSRFYVPLGFAIGLSKNIEGKIEPRSGFSGKGVEGVGKKWGWKFLFGFLPVYCRCKGNYRFDCDVIVGKIDPGYKGEVNVIVKNYDVAFTIQKNTKLAQMTFYRTRSMQFVKTDEIHGFDRGGGLGHSGSKIKIAMNDEGENK